MSEFKSRWSPTMSSSSAKLHVSGLTPSISEHDLKSKLSSFGTVKSLDGFGAKDGNGDPRTFVFATLDAQAGQVAKCVNALSGTTWKGAKLRLAPAKPDFRQRFEKDRAEAESESPRKKKRVHGREAEDMKLVTVENVKTHKGWYKTPLNHLMHPVRTRPLHPLPPTMAKTSERQKGKKSRVKAAPTRARRRTIDPAKWGATHLSGPLLENAVVAEMPATAHGKGHGREADIVIPQPASDDSSSSSSSGATSDSGSESVDGMDEVAEDRVTDVVVEKELSSDAVARTLRGETMRNKQLLASMFSNNDWQRQDDLDSDIDELVKKTKSQKIGPTIEADTESDEKPGTRDKSSTQTLSVKPAIPVDVDMSSASEDEEDEAQANVPTQAPQLRSLKEMFAPREEEAGFSLLANLDFELELDDEFSLGVHPTIAPTPVPIPAMAQTQPVVASSTDEWRIGADAPGLRPLFFPSIASLNYHGFWRTETDEQIRAKWEEQRGALTEDWKKRAREAKKRGRRGGPGAVTHE